MLIFKSIGELVIPSTESSRIEWNISNFFSLTTENGFQCTLESPPFLVMSETLKIVLILNVPQNWFLAQVVHADEASRATHLIHKKGIKQNNAAWGHVDSAQSKTLRPWKITDYRGYFGQCSITAIYVEFLISDNTIASAVPLPSLPVRHLKTSPPLSVAPENKKGRDILSKNLKELYENGLYCDFTISVGERKFKAHKAILATRSKVFAAMLQHDLAEKETNETDINDCDPGAFHEFLLYLYSGQVDTFSDESVAALYRIADKYDVQDLKEECVGYMMRNLSVDKFCSFIELASNHDEKEFLKLLKSFFIKNAKNIISSANWETFLIQNMTLAKELCLLMVPDN